MKDVLSGDIAQWFFLLITVIWGFLSWQLAYWNRTENNPKVVLMQFNRIVPCRYGNYSSIRHHIDTRFNLTAGTGCCLQYIEIGGDQYDQANRKFARPYECALSQPRPINSYGTTILNPSDPDYPGPSCKGLQCSYEMSNDLINYYGTHDDISPGTHGPYCHQQDCYLSPNILYT